MCTNAPSRRSKPLSSSTSPTWLASNRPAAMAATSKTPERRMPVSFVGKRSRVDVTQSVARLLDPGCATMTRPRPAHETTPNWPPSNWNGGRDQIGIGGRLRRNPQSVVRQARYEYAAVAVPDCDAARCVTGRIRLCISQISDSPTFVAKPVLQGHGAEWLIGRDELEIEIAFLRALFEFGP